MTLRKRAFPAYKRIPFKRASEHYEVTVLDTRASAPRLERAGCELLWTKDFADALPASHTYADAAGTDKV